MASAIPPSRPKHYWPFLSFGPAPLTRLAGRRRRAVALASVRRPNCTYSFPVCSFHEDSVMPRCKRRNQPDQVHKPILTVQRRDGKLLPPTTSPRGECYFTLALRYDFTSIRSSKGLSPSSCRTCSAHQKKRDARARPSCSFVWVRPLLIRPSIRYARQRQRWCACQRSDKDHLHRRSSRQSIFPRLPNGGCRQCTHR